MSKLIIKGGNPISGIITPAPNKNSILKLIPATILINTKVRFTNFPKTTSTIAMLEILKDLGGEYELVSDNEVIIDSRNVNKSEVDDYLASKERSSLMFLGPLIAKFGTASVKDSGGCKLGVRPLDTMFQGLKALGIEINGDKKYELNAANGIIGNENIWLLEASVTGTENLILASILAKGRTIIYNAACEPHTQDLCNFLVANGAIINGIGTNKLIIDGVSSLNQREEIITWNVIPDHIDIGGLIVAASITNGELLIKDAIPQHMTQIINHFKKINLKVEVIGNDIFVAKNQSLECLPNYKGDLDKIPDQPWPGYPVDLIPQILILATLAKGNIRVHSYMYETQLFFVEELKKLNARLHLANPHTVITLGPSKFRSAKINCPDIIQAAHALILAGLAADGETTLINVDHVFRRYPDIINEFTNLGAEIRLVNE